MIHIMSLRGLTAVLSLSITAATVYAHGDKATDERAQKPHEMHNAKPVEHHGTHRHDSWVAPPQDYATKRWDGWDDTSAAQRGEALYEQHCASCHGEDGRGTGPAAKGLAHAPADLTNHFHRAPGDGDGYLFWRVSKGGTVEPFRSQKSAMPAFKSILDPQQRWEVLTYVHQKMHGGFHTASGHGTHADEHHGRGPEKTDTHHKH